MTSYPCCCRRAPKLLLPLSIVSNCVASVLYVRLRMDDFSGSNSPLKFYRHINPFKPEITIVIFIHYKARIAVAIRD